MDASARSWAKELLNAFHAGNKKKPVFGKAQTGELFRELMDKALHANLTVEAINEFQRIERLRKPILKLSRLRNLSAANDATNILIENTRHIPVDSQLRYLCDSFNAASIAYLRFREQDFESAEELMRFAMTRDILLEPHMSVIFLHRIQLSINLAKVVYMRGLVTQAMLRLHQLIRFLCEEQCASGLFYSDTWHHEKLTSIPKELVSAATGEAFGELIHMMNANEPIAKKIAQSFNKIGRAEPSYAKEISVADGIKRAYLAKQLNSKDRTLLEALRDGPQEIPVLWYSIARDVTLNLLGSNHHEAQLVGKEMKVAWLKFPPKIREKICGLPSLSVA